VNKIQAVLICKNDFKRLEFTLSHFTAFNKNIPIKVLNADGDDPSSIVAQFPGCLKVRRVGQSGSTVGWWRETSDVGGHYVIEDDSVRIKECDLSATLVHNYKV
jgi:hypothetical protein